MCWIVANQPVRGKLGDQEIAAMIRGSAQPAPDTFGKVAGVFRQIKGEFTSDLAGIGLEVEEKMQQG